eukprot:PhM_4_TR18673/c0_g1_i1/m.71142
MCERDLHFRITDLDLLGDHDLNVGGHLRRLHPLGLEGLVHDSGVVLERLHQFGVRGLVVDVDNVLNNKTGLLAHLLCVAHKLTGAPNADRLRVLTCVKEHNPAVLRVSLVVRHRGLDNAHNLHVVAGQLVPQDRELAARDELLHHLRRGLLEGVDDGLGLLLDALAQDGEVALERGHGDLLGGRRADFEDVDFLSDVVLEGKHVRDEIRLGVAHDELAHRCLEGHVHTVAEHTHHVDDRLHTLHGALDLRHDERFIGLRQHRVVHAVLTLVLGEKHAQTLVHDLGDEGREGRHHAARHVEHLEQRAEGVNALGLAGAALHATAVHAHVPIREVLEEAHNTRDDSVETVLLHLAVHVRREGLS